MRHWLMKSEPESYSIDDLKRDRRTAWSGVRNFQARNFMRDMNVGDLAFFHHSSADPAGIVGVMKVVAVAHPDLTQFDRMSPYYEPRAKKASPDAKAMGDKPVWWCVDVAFVKKFPRLIPLEELRGTKTLKGMVLFQRGSRLSVQPVEKRHFDAILKMI